MDTNKKLPAFSSVGCYTLIYLDSSDNVLCAPCATEDGLTENNAHPFWEGPDMSCDECGDVMESSYGDPDADSEEE